MTRLLLMRSLTALAAILISTSFSSASIPKKQTCLFWTCPVNVVREAARHPVVHRSFSRHVARAQGLDALVSTLADKVREIMGACGSKLISGYRPGAVVAGTHHRSLHSAYPSRAADMAGNPSCIYALLQHWQGGYSTDYGRVRHVHISYSPPGSGDLAGHEWHARFAHGGFHHHRFAHRYKHRRIT